MSALTVDEVKLEVGPTARILRYGSDEPIVFLHGLTGISSTDPLIEVLSKDFSVLAPVAPGFADINELAHIDSVHELAMFYDDLLESVGIREATVVGHSFGGMVAAELAAHCPTRVANLVLIAPFGLWDDDEPVLDLLGCSVPEIMQYLWSDLGSESARAFTGQELEFDAQVERMIEMVQSFAAVAKFLWPIPEKGLAKRLHRVRARTLILWGAKDRILPPSYAERFRKRLGAATRVELVKDAGHMVAVEQPVEVARLLRDFLGAPT